MPTVVKQGSWDPEHNSASVSWILLWGRELATGMGWDGKRMKPAGIRSLLIVGMLLQTQVLVETCWERFIRIEI